MTKKGIGLAVVGRFKGFDVIIDVTINRQNPQNEYPLTII
jgi:hypothetical protein